jgi:tetratricopeptide (TPR) repeat protein
MGEPGVGKSRLFYEFIHSHRTQGWLVLESEAVSYGKATPFLPLVELLKRYFKIVGGDDARAIRAKVTGNVLTLDDALKDSIPPLLWLLDALPEDHKFLALEPSQRRDSSLDAVKRVLLRESHNQPLLLVFEDLHWIDAETQRLLDGLVESLPSVAVLLAANYRPEYQHSWGSKTYYRQLRIDPLPPESAEALLAPLLGDDSSLHRLRRLLIERTEGNPFFLEESVRSLVETGVLVGERGAYLLGKDPMVIQVPATVQVLLAARIDRLPPDDKQLLQTASVIGKDVPWALLLEVSELPEDDLRGGLARLQAAELVYETKLFPDLEFTFKHALTHEVAYASLLQDHRRVLHARIVEGIERVYADRLAEHIDRLAHHAFRGELWDKATHYLRQTGLLATQPSIDALISGPESPGHLWWCGEHDRAITSARAEQAVSASFGNFSVAIAANLRLGQAYHSLGEYSKAVEVLERNVTLLEGDLRRELLGLAGFPSVFSRVWLTLCLAEQGKFEQAAARAEEAVAISEAGDHAFSLVVAHAGNGMLHGQQGDYSNAIRSLERGLVPHIPLLFPFVAAPLGWVYTRAGRQDEGLGLLKDAVQRAEAMGFAANHALRLVWLAEANLLVGDGDAAKRLALRALDLARRHGERGHQAYILGLLGELALKESVPDVEQAVEHYRAALALAQMLGMQPLAAALARSLP